MTRIRILLLAIILSAISACAVTPSAPMFPRGAAPTSPVAPSTSSAASTVVDDGTDVAGPPTPAPQPASGAPVVKCPTGWGTTAKTDPAMGPAPITGVRAGRHACFDRLVVDVDGTATGYTASYVDTVTADGSGNPVTVPGAARIQLVIQHPETTPAAVGSQLANVAGFDTFRSVIAAGSFEGITTIGIGVRARLPMRVTVLQNPGRFVIDVAKS